MTPSTELSFKEIAVGTTVVYRNDSLFCKGSVDSIDHEGCHLSTGFLLQGHMQAYADDGVNDEAMRGFNQAIVRTLAMNEARKVGMEDEEGWVEARMREVEEAHPGLV